MKTKKIGAALSVAIILLILNLWHVSKQAEYDKQYIIYSQELRILSQSLAKNAEGILNGKQGALDSLKSERNAFNYHIEALKKGFGGYNREKIANNELRTLIQTWLPFEEKISFIISSATDKKKYILVNEELFLNSSKLLEQATLLTTAYTLAPSDRLFAQYSGYILWIICLSLLIFLIQIIYRDIQANIKRTNTQNKENEVAIQNLVEEIKYLATSDLTVSATVRKTITKKIAESINYALSAIRKSILTITHTSKNVELAAQNVVNTGQKLAEASESQAQKIVGVTASVNAITSSIEHVSNNAEKSASVAENSLGIANKGVTVVADMIMGMGQIRQQIQETATQIKKVGERTQEIGDMVSLIDDIADQTNILSLNAAIQAAMAGDAGRGFAVVADEVQRLAERSGHATREIDGLVKKMQQDTKVVVVSMEQTTSEVVQGARLAEDAGVALEKIETVSRELSELINSISKEAQQQAITSGKISKNMDAIQNIAVQTASGTSETACSIGKLADLVVELRDSIAKFKVSSTSHG